MAYTKAERQKFLEALDQGREVMPQGVIKRELTLFEDTIEVDRKTNYQKITLALRYPILTENTNGDPMAKQSARFTVQRYAKGEKKGEPIIFMNKNTNKPDVMIKSYQDAKIKNTTQVLQYQINQQLAKQRFTKFRGAIFITRMEFVFKVYSSATKKMLDDLKTGNMIYFKDTKPDLDNLEKLVWDAMQIEKADKDVRNAMTGLVYDNDAQIVSKNGIFKRWGLTPGVIIEMEGYTL